MTTGIIEKVFLKGTITALTGLRVGGTDQGLSVGGLQNIVIRHALLDEPYVPGSSLRGKIRCSLERLHGVWGRRHGKMIEYGPCNDARLPYVQLFGTERARLTDQEENDDGGEDQESRSGSTIPSRLLVRDALLTPKSRARLDPLRGDLRMTETKTEVCIDRVTSAANPRTFERVPAGAELDFQMVLEVRALPPGNAESEKAHERVLAALYEKRKPDNDWGRDQDLKWILIGLDLLQDDALGGQGSRGYGRVKIKLDMPTVRTRADYENGTPGGDLELPQALRDRLDALNERGAKERQQIVDTLPGGST